VQGGRPQRQGQVVQGRQGDQTERSQVRWPTVHVHKANIVFQERIASGGHKTHKEMSSIFADL
jgi:hypothetical protein